VWISFGFTSDGLINYEGAYLDDIVIQKGTVDVLSVISSFASPGSSPWGLTWDGVNLWNSDDAADRAYKLSTTGTVLSSFYTPSSSPGGMAWDGTNLWLADDNTRRIYKLTTTGSIVTSFSTPGSIPTGLAWDGTYLWLCDLSVSTIWKLTTTGQVVSSFSAPGISHSGLSWNGNSLSLWLTDAGAGLIYELNTAGNVLNCYLPPIGSPTDSEWDGSDYWLADSYNDRIYKLRGPVIGPNPLASFTVSPPSGFVSTIFAVDASSSRDLQTPTAQLQVRWDWENDGNYDTEFTTVKTATHQYSTPGTYTIKLEVKDTDGNTGTTPRNVTVNSRAPQPFDLVRPLSGDTVRAFTPTFVWRVAVDEDPGDTLRYTLYYSTSSAFYSSSTDTIKAGTDTSVTLSDSLVEKTRYYWKVRVTDRWGSTTMSRQAYNNFLVADLTPPSFTVAILQNPIMTEDIDIYAIPNEALDAFGARAEANGTLVAMLLLDPSNRIYAGDYQLSASGMLMVIVSGKDAIWGNEGRDTLSVPVQLIKAAEGGLIASSDARMQVSFPSRTIDRDAYVMILPGEEFKNHNHDLPKENAEKLDEVVPIGKSYLIAPAQLSLTASVTLVFSYSDEEIEGRTEAKLEIARKEGSQWVSLGGDVNEASNHVSVQVDRLGEYRLQWNLNRKESASELPTEYALLQNYPNPFNPETTIRYALPQGFHGHVDITVYNITGQQVKLLVDKLQGPGYYSVLWDVTDDFSRSVASGVYLYRLKTDQFVVVRKMLFLR